MFNNAKIITVPNKGYDIYPFLIVLSKVKLDEYDYILKIHTKNSRKDCLFPGNNFIPFERKKAPKTIIIITSIECVTC